MHFHMVVTPYLKVNHWGATTMSTRGWRPGGGG